MKPRTAFRNGFETSKVFMKNCSNIELTWVGKNNRHRLEPRVLVEDSKKSHHAKVRHGEHDIFDNMDAIRKEMED